MRTEGFSADDSVRPALPASPEELSDLGRWIFAEHQKLIGMRRRNAWLTHADVEVTDKTNETISLRAFGSGDDGEHSLTLDAWLDPAPGVRVHSEDGVEYEWLG